MLMTHGTIVSNTQDSRAPAARAGSLRPSSRRRWLLGGAGLVLFHLSVLLAGKEEGLWLPCLGLGLALVAWLGQVMVPVLALDLFLARTSIRVDHGLLRIAGDSLLLAAEMGFSWWAYAQLARGSRRLEDPRSATVFLMLVPGGLAISFASLQALFWGWSAGAGVDFWALTGSLWVSRALGILALVPPLFVVLRPYLVQHGLTWREPAAKLPGGGEPRDWTWGEIIETAGLCAGAGLLALVLVTLQFGRGMPGWTLWGISLLVVVWAAQRQGLRGGALAAAVSAVFALGPASWWGISAADFSPLQGNLLAQCSTALLVGASASWIRASEARYRQVVGHIPVALYSARLPRGLDLPLKKARGHLATQPGPTIAAQAEVTLVSSAARQIFGTEPDELLGPYAAWLERIDPADRELVVAALAQLCMQEQPVTCEYRIRASAAAAQSAFLDSVPDQPPGAPYRWVRDTLVPYRISANTLDGWEGVIEDITEQRALSYNLRRTSGMLQALITHLPTGIFFVQGPMGQPILVNQRARQLLGQREDLAAGIDHISTVYRLYRPDGSPYPAAELPVTRALREGITSMANDVVVQRSDGRRVPLVTWAAPVDFSGQGRADAAVWVLEDLTALQQAESALSESEARLRAIIESMGEGVVVQDQDGAILDCNPAACVILGMAYEELLGRPSLGAATGCLREDDSPLGRDDQPDRLALRTGVPVRNVIMGIPAGAQASQPGGLRWIFVNAMPLPANVAVLPGKSARVVTTFADITAHRQAIEELQRAQRLELVGRLASGTIHDFNNLLTVMVGLAGLVQAGLPPDHVAQGDLDRLMEAGEQASHLAGQLLTFSKQGRPVPHGVDINTVVVHSLKLLKGSLPTSIEVEHQLAGDVLLVQGDENQLKQVVMNLCLNSRDAMSQGGKLTVATEMVDRPPPSVAAANGHPWIRLSVQDTGAGMEDTLQKHIFEPFFSTKQRGTGLGLVVVRQIVESFGGRIQVWSKPGEGTRMDVWLMGMGKT